MSKHTYRCVTVHLRRCQTIKIKSMRQNFYVASSFATTSMKAGGENMSQHTFLSTMSVRSMRIILHSRCHGAQRKAVRAK